MPVACSLANYMQISSPELCLSFGLEHKFALTIFGEMHWLGEEAVARSCRLRNLIHRGPQGEHIARWLAACS